MEAEIILKIKLRDEEKEKKERILYTRPHISDEKARIC